MKTSDKMKKVLIREKKIQIKWLRFNAFVKESDVSCWLKKSHLEKIKVLSNAKTLTVIPDKDWGNVNHSTWFWVVA